MSTNVTNASPDPLAGDLIGSGVEGGLRDQVTGWVQRMWKSFPSSTKK